MEPVQAPSSRARGWNALAIVLIAAALAAAYAGCLGAPFESDDLPGIRDNHTLRNLAALRTVLSPPVDTTASGRPVLNLSFAVSYALGGLDPRGFRLGNLLIHFSAALTLYALIATALEGLRAKAEPGRLSPRAFALSCALIWAVHPLQTESVTYVVQRAESLAGLFILLSLFGLALAARRGGKFWTALSVGSCLLGEGTKEIAACTPLLALFFDRAFLAGSFKEALKLRGRLHLMLAATWIPLLALAWATGSRSGTSGFGVGVPAGQYWFSQGPAIARYLRLAFWPTGQVFDYGTQWAELSVSVLLEWSLVAGLAGASAWALWRRPRLGFLGLCFFAVLAPTSLIPGNRQTLAEHRMYLPLAAVVIFALLGFELLAGIWAKKRAARQGRPESGKVR